MNKLLLDIVQYAQVCLICVFQCSVQHAAFSVVQRYICNNGKGSYQKLTKKVGIIQSLK